MDSPLIELNKGLKAIINSFVDIFDETDLFLNNYNFLEKNKGGSKFHERNLYATVTRWFTFQYGLVYHCAALSQFWCFYHILNYFTKFSVLFIIICLKRGWESPTHYGPAPV